MKKLFIVLIAIALFSCKKNEVVVSENMINKDTISKEIKNPKITVEELVKDENYVPYHKKKDASSDRASFGDANSKEKDLEYLGNEKVSN